MAQIFDAFSELPSGESNYDFLRPALSDQIRLSSDSDLKMVLAELAPNIDVFNLNKVIGNSTKLAPTLQRALPGAVRGAAAGATLGPVGAVGGAIVGGLAAGLRGRRTDPTFSTDPRTGAGITQTGRPLPSPEQPPHGPPSVSHVGSRRTTSQTPTPGLSGMTTREPAAQLFAVCANPATLQALAALALGQAGASQISVAGRDVPPTAFANLMIVLASRLLAQHARTTAPRPHQPDVPEYLLKANGEPLPEINNPAERAQRLLILLAREAAFQTSAADGSERSKITDEDPTIASDTHQ